METLPEALGPGEHCKALQKLFSLRPLSSRAADAADFPNTEKQTERLRQNEMTEELVPNGGKG